MYSQANEPGNGANCQLRSKSKSPDLALSYISRGVGGFLVTYLSLRKTPLKVSFLAHSVLLPETRHFNAWGRKNKLVHCQVWGEEVHRDHSRGKNPPPSADILLFFLPALSGRFHLPPSHLKKVNVRLTVHPRCWTCPLIYRTNAKGKQQFPQ